MNQNCYPVLFDYEQLPRNKSDLQHTNEVGRIEYGNSNWFDTIGLVILTIVLVTINICLIVGLRKTNRKLTLSQKLYTYLSCVDTISALTFPALAYPTYNLDIHCKRFAISMAFLVFVYFVSLEVFVVISIVRNLSIRNPLIPVRRRKVYYYLGGLNIMTLGILTLASIAYYPSLTNRQLLASYFICGSTILFISTILTSSFNIWSKRCLRKHAIETTEVNQNHKSQQRAVTILLLITLVYAVCNIPTVVYYMYLGITLLRFENNGERFIDGIKFFLSLNASSFLCGGINALVYMAGSPEIRNFYKKLIFCKSNQQHTREQNN